MTTSSTTIVVGSGADHDRAARRLAEPRSWPTQTNDRGGLRARWHGEVRRDDPAVGLAPRVEGGDGDRRGGVTDRPDGGEDLGCAAAVDDARAESHVDAERGLDGDPEVVHRLAIGVDRRHDAHHHEVVAGGIVERRVDREPERRGGGREQADDRSVESDPVRVDAVDDGGHPIDDVRGVGDLDLDASGRAGANGEVREAELGPRPDAPTSHINGRGTIIRCAPLPTAARPPYRGGDVSTTTSSPGRALTRNRPAALHARRADG